MSEQDSQSSSGFSWQPKVETPVSEVPAEPNTNAGLSYGNRENAVPTDPDPSASGAFVAPASGDGGQSVRPYGEDVFTQPVSAENSWDGSIPTSRDPNMVHTSGQVQIVSTATPPVSVESVVPVNLHGSEVFANPVPSNDTPSGFREDESLTGDLALELKSEGTGEVEPEFSGGATSKDGE